MLTLRILNSVGKHSKTSYSCSNKHTGTLLIDLHIFLSMLDHTEG
ncbi:hypothetical protein HanXRQr2_Chr14g0620311 [Helianthus annuus]|uniref:Uncharacterized protein n=1 Tax=Helianthus annuus TaxID=4232 RepID=A0A9K3E734_HELAN|nr:hypothetical protein HanXRQr2_Chr14g0620311 [Helianthus annuus]